jgi:hypothetical protein
VSFNSKLFVRGDASLNSKLNVGGDASFNSKFYVFNDVSFNSKLFVNGDASLNSKLNVGGDASFNSKFYVFNDVSFNSKLFVRGDASLNSKLNVGGDASFNSKFYVFNDVSFNSKLFVNGDASLNSKLNVGGDASFNSKFYVFNDVSFNSKLFVNGDASLNSKLNVGGDASFNSKFYVFNDVSFNSKLFVNGDASLNSKLNVGGDASFNSKFYVFNDVSFNSKLFVNGDASLNSKLNVGGDASFNSKFYVFNDVSFNSKLFVNGDASLNSRLNVGGDASFNSKFYVFNDVSFNSKLFVRSDVSMNGNLSINMDLSLNGNLYVTKRALFTLDVSAIGNMDIGSGTNSVSINKDISSSFALDVSGTTKIRGDMDVSGVFTVNGAPVTAGAGGSLTGNVQIGTDSGFVTIDKPQFYSDPSLTIFYDFDSASYTGTTITNKAPSGGFTATLQGTTTGMIDTSTFKNGTASLRNDLINSNNQGIKVNSSVPIGTFMTFSFWLRKKSTPPTATFDRIFEFSEYTSPQGGAETNTIALDISSSGIILPALTSGSGSCFGTLTTPNISYNVCDDTWKHIVWVINGSSSVIYINGSSTQQDAISPTPFSVSPTRTNALIGNSNYNIASRDFSGNIDDFRYYKDKALTYPEIYQLYNNNFYTLDICGGFLANGSSVIYESSGSIATANRGTLTLMHGDASGSSSIMFKSVNDTTDYAYIEYDENVTGSTGTNYGLMTIGIENDATASTTQGDRISLFASGGRGFVGVNTKTPQVSLDISGQVRIYEGAGTTAAATGGSLTLEHANTGGTSSLVFKASNSSTTQDYAYVQYEDNTNSNPISLYKYDFSSNISLANGVNFTSTNVVIPSTGSSTGDISCGLTDSSLCWTNVSTNFPASFPTTPAPYCISFNQYNLRDISTARINYLQTKSDLNTNVDINSISTSFWINPSIVGNTLATALDVSSAYNILDLSGVSSHLLSFFLFRRKLFVVMDSSTNPYGNSLSTDVSVNNWYHIALTTNSVTDKFSLYKNNVLQTDICGTPHITNTPFTNIALGWRPGYSTGTRDNAFVPYQKGFAGRMAYVNVFNKELSSADVSLLYQNPGYNSTTTERGLMTIGIENDNGYINNDRIVLWPGAGSGFVGINNKTPQSELDVSGTINTNTDIFINGMRVGRSQGNNVGNVAFGQFALESNFGTDSYQNSAIGYQTLRYNTAYKNTAVGSSTLNLNTTGYENTAIGALALNSHTTGYQNTGIGCQVLKNITTQTNNTAVGFAAGNGASASNVGNFNTFLGSNTYQNGSGTNNTYVGYGAYQGSTNHSNSTAIGTGALISASNQVQLGFNCTAQATSFNATSDYREKDNVMELDETFTVDTLRPVVYDFKPLGKKHIGFIAHEVQEFYPFLVSGEKDGPHSQSMNYNGFIGILTKEIQVLKKKVAEQEAKALEQDTRIQTLEKLILNK